MGEGDFVDAVARVSEGTLDRDMSGEREKQGPREAAREFFEEEQDWSTSPGGRSSRTRPPSTVIDYIGVMPERRGEGYVDDLLVRGAQTLISAGAERIRADTDTANTPMAGAFRRAGYAEFAARREYEADLSRSPRPRSTDKDEVPTTTIR